MRAAKYLSIALALAVTGLPAIVVAHDHATGVVKERMDAMEAMAKRNKAISERIRTKRELAAIKADAEAIAGLAAHIPHLFPPGSGQHPTRARAAIWQNWADFESKARALEAASRTLAAAKVDDAAALGAAASAMVKTCTACHERYRARR
jgi:cytochrome c556